MHESGMKLVVIDVAFDLGLTDVGRRAVFRPLEARGSEYPF